MRHVVEWRANQRCKDRLCPRHQGTECSSLGTAASFVPLVSATDDRWLQNIGGMIITGKERIPGEKPDLLSLCQSRIPRGIPTANVGGLRG